MDIDLKKAEDFYLEAMKKCYAGEEVPKTTINNLPGSKVYTYERDQWRYIDCYFSSCKGRSFGQTIIVYFGVPVWWMQYHGELVDIDNSKVIISFLKESLRHSNVFIGGRGPYYYGPKDGMIYKNTIRFRVKPLNFFERFEGREDIYGLRERGAKLLFWHEYVGGIL